MFSCLSCQRSRWSHRVFAIDREWIHPRIPAVCSRLLSPKTAPHAPINTVCRKQKEIKSLLIEKKSNIALSCVCYKHVKFFCPPQQRQLKIHLNCSFDASLPHSVNPSISQLFISNLTLLLLERLLSDSKALTLGEWWQRWISHPMVWLTFYCSDLLLSVEAIQSRSFTYLQ